MLRTILTLMLVIAPLTASAAPLMQIDLAVRLDPGTHSLEGRADLSRIDTRSAWPHLYRLAAPAEILAVEGEEGPLRYTFEQGLLQVMPGGSVAELSITYRVRFDDPLPDDHVGIEDPTFGVTATIRPEGTFLSADSGWHPVPDGTSNLFRVTVEGPQKLTAVTAGRLLEHSTAATTTTTVWQTRLPQATLALAGGDYQLERAQLGSIQVLAFTSPANAALARPYLEATLAYLELYQELFGPYPYAKFAVVENFYPTGYGLPGWTLLGSRVIRLPFIRTTSLPHEIAHAWWGNAIEIDYASGNWGEGLATYVADYYLKELDDTAEALEYRRKILRDYAALADGDDLPLTAFRSRMSKRDQAVGYGKAAMVFHMLRKRIGDDAFWLGLRAAAREGIGERYAWSDLRRHFEAASGDDLEAFFRQWTERSGAPALALRDVAMMPVDGGWQISGIVRQQTSPLYDLALPLRLTTAERRYDQVLGFAAREECFVFTVAERPTRLAVDPENDVFRQLDPSELPATVNHLRAAKAPLVVIATGAEALLEASRDLLRGLQWHTAEIVQEKDLGREMPTDRDLLFIGWPEAAGLRPALPDGFRIAGRQFTVDDTIYSEAEDVLFLVTKSVQGERVRGYFLPASVTAARDAARRIPHYGRYSYLVFREGRNRLKATWEPSGTPLQIDFKQGF